MTPEEILERNLSRGGNPYVDVPEEPEDPPGEVITARHRKVVAKQHVPDGDEGTDTLCGRELGNPDRFDTAHFEDPDWCRDCLRRL